MLFYRQMFNSAQYNQVNYNSVSSLAVFIVSLIIGQALPLTVLDTAVALGIFDGPKPDTQTEVTFMPIQNYDKAVTLSTTERTVILGQ